MLELVASITARLELEGYLTHNKTKRGGKEA